MPLETTIINLKHRAFLPILLILPALALPRLRANYLEYLSLGPGGLPHNIFGWLAVLCLRPFGREVLRVSIYGSPNGTSERWLEEGSLGKRESEQRPVIGWHYIPHRQRTQLAGQEMRQRLVASFTHVAALNMHLIDVIPSPHEQTVPAMVIKRALPTPHKVAEHAWREIAHVHSAPGADWSMHVVLSPLDCKQVIENGWGERHPLSGSFMLPKEYLMIYAPRTDRELAVAEKILGAAIGYMTSSREVVFA